MKNYILNLFKELVSYDTTSDPNSKTYPSTTTQLDFGKILYNKCIEIGLTDVKIDNYGYVTATLPATLDNGKAIGFISHIDTSSDANGSDIQVVVTENYSGGDIVLKGTTISPKEFPILKRYIGNTILTSDGTTLLGADDKAGIAEILTAMKFLLENKDIPHNKIRIAFTPDEEIGAGVDHFNVKDFGCDFAYTVDGEAVGELNYENFNAARAEINISGRSVHPGYAKDTMINASKVAFEFDYMLPKDEIPAKTSGYEGFFHLTNMKGSTEKAYLEYIIRDFDKALFEKRKETLSDIADKINTKYGKDIISLSIHDEYENMLEVFNDKKDIIDLALNSIKEAGLTPNIVPIRGGTDGARLSFMGLPCPNIFTGGHNFHGNSEFIPLESMLKATEVIINIAKSVEV